MIGIVAEYNPFHNGHIYQINWIKKNYPNEKIIVAMSGKYSQRGELCVASFESRKTVAKLHGVFEVYEIPHEFVNQAAHVFADAAVKLLKKKELQSLFLVVNPMMSTTWF